MIRRVLYLSIALGLLGCGSRPTTSERVGTIVDYGGWLCQGDSVRIIGVSKYSLTSSPSSPAADIEQISPHFTVTEGINSQHFLIQSDGSTGENGSGGVIQWWNGQRYFIIDKNEVEIFRARQSESLQQFENPLLLPFRALIQWFDKGNVNSIADFRSRYADTTSFRAFCTSCMTPGSSALFQHYRNINNIADTMEIRYVALGDVILPQEITTDDGAEKMSFTMQWRRSGDSRPVLSSLEGHGTSITGISASLSIRMSDMRWGGLTDAAIAVDLGRYDHFYDADEHAPISKRSIQDGTYLTSKTQRVWWGTGPCGLKNENGPHGGALVGCLYEGSPAKISGLHLGDEILDIDGTKITNWDQIRSFIINTAHPGKNFSVTVMRDGKNLKFSSFMIDLDSDSLAKMASLGATFYKP